MAYRAHVPASSTYQLLDFVADLDALTSSYTGAKPTLVGHSLGGVVAALLAGARPGRFGALVLVEKPLPSGGGDGAGRATRLPGGAAESSNLRRPGRGGGAMRRGYAAMSKAQALALAERITERTAAGLTWRWDAGCERGWVSRNRGWRGHHYLNQLRGLTPVPGLSMAQRAAS